METISSGMKAVPRRMVSIPGWWTAIPGEMTRFWEDSLPKLLLGRRRRAEAEKTLAFCLVLF
ncbi:MAG TPA: hypothetical protein VEL74_14985 [Thermoanaerobaculia bacterium]|nr:hypothetical protein [Thermoanaerobaculia bacterium]